jgi:hypothetical protein
LRTTIIYVRLNVSIILNGSLRTALVASFITISVSNCITILLFDPDHTPQSNLQDKVADGNGSSCSSSSSSDSTPIDSKVSNQQITALSRPLNGMVVMLLS